MLATLVVLLRTLGLLCSGHGAVALENVALPQQLSVLRRTTGARTSARAIDCLGSCSPTRCGRFSIVCAHLCSSRVLKNTVSAPALLVHVVMAD